MICPKCNLKYKNFRTGLTYNDVYNMIFSRQWKRRNGVLGYWHEFKLKMWADHKEMCGKEILENDKYETIAY